MPAHASLSQLGPISNANVKRKKREDVVFDAEYSNLSKKYPPEFYISYALFESTK